MEVNPPDLNNMTIEEKIRLMETIWEDLSKNAKNISSPDWHNEILREREIEYKKGTEKSIDWENAKNQIRNNLR